MAVKASDQISIVDVTDAYSITLTSEAYTFVGSASGVASGNSCSTQAVAYCGTNQCSNVTVDSSKIICPTGISASVSNSGSSVVTISFTTTATISKACEAIIPVSVDGITINKKFSFAVAIAGQKGEDGKAGTNGKDGTNGKNGADAITMSISSSNGTVFKNSSGSTVLTAHVYKGGAEQTITDAGVCGSLGSVKWYKGTSTTAFKTSKTITVSASEVDNALAYTCQLEG